MCLSAENGGDLPPVEDIAYHLRIPDVETIELMRQLSDAGFLDMSEDGPPVLHNWNGRQQFSAIDNSADRVRKFRERQKEKQAENDEESSLFPEIPVTVTETVSSNSYQSFNGNACNAPRIEKKRSRLDKKVTAAQRHRSIAQIEEVLGERMVWWDGFWSVFPCHEGKRACMDVFEVLVRSRSLAVEIYRGAKKYAAYVEANPDTKMKWGQGWLNEERWTDENRTARKVIANKQEQHSEEWTN
jgi:hypothetical protein